jgi:hypothetical protein
MNPQSTQNVVFSAFTAILISSAFIMSRWSSNPMFLQILFTELLPWWKHNETCLFRNWSFRETQAVDTKNSEARVTYRTKPNDASSSIVLELGTSAAKKQPSPVPSGMKKNESVLSEMMNGSNIEDPLPSILRNTLS